jgi:hypothetical protein
MVGGKKCRLPPGVRLGRGGCVCHVGFSADDKAIADGERVQLPAQITIFNGGGYWV